MKLVCRLVLDVGSVAVRVVAWAWFACDTDMEARVVSCPGTEAGNAAPMVKHKAVTMIVIKVPIIVVFSFSITFNPEGMVNDK